MCDHAGWSWLDLSFLQPMEDVGFDMNVRRPTSGMFFTPVDE